MVDKCLRLLGEEAGSRGLGCDYGWFLNYWVGEFFNCFYGSEFGESLFVLFVWEIGYEVEGIFFGRNFLFVFFVGNEVLDREGNVFFLNMKGSCITNGRRWKFKVVGNVLL